jgi:hypothetical protein
MTTMISNQLTNSIKLIPIIFIIGLSACSSSSNTVTKPDSPSPSVSINAIKSYTFSWSQVADATHYKLLENADGMSGFTQVGNNIAASATNYEHIIPLYNRLNAEYILQACNSAGCSDSSMLAAAPTASQLQAAIGYVKASNAEKDDAFGSALSISGDGLTLAISATGEDSNATSINGDDSDNNGYSSGAVYVFTRAGAGWSQQAYIKADDSAVDDGFGTSISLNQDGTTLAVGAIDEDTSANNAGSVYIFTRSGTTWSQEDTFQADDAGANQYFGIAVSLSDNGSTLAVGAATSSGSAYVFTRTNSAWTQQQKLVANNAQASDEFGNALSLSGDALSLAIGATGQEHNVTETPKRTATTSFNYGAAYIFTVEAGTWTQQAFIKASNPESYDQFGYAISLNQDGTTLAVGAIKEDSDSTAQSNNDAVSAGAVYVYSRSGTTWTQQAYLKASNAEAYDQFGSAVSLSNDGSTLAIGAATEESNATGISTDATGESDNTADGSGAVYLFSRSGSTWSQIAYIKASNAAEDDRFGEALSLNGDGNTLAVSALAEASCATGVDGDQADNSAENSGAVYLY